VPGRPAVTPSPIFRGGDGLVVLAMAGLVVPFGLGALAEWGWISLHGPGGGYALEVIFSVVLWTGMIATCLFVSRRYGSRSLRSDYRIRFRPIDVLIAIGGAIVARVLSGLVALWIEHLNFVHLPVSTNPLVTSSSIPAGGWIVLIVCTCLGAPFFEELFFRGLLQELLLERIGGFLSVALTAAVFATGHIFNAQGLAGVAYAMEILPAGLVLCCIKAAAGRLGSSMLTHLVYNASVLLILAWQVGQLHL
jgi:membrane protease YdiL (CAAX protease family)